ncbi:MAG: PH domain-containing protein [Actinobacteria bacterium]|nr:PH domain-containing protein [Actinomycetota bacterium]
MYEVFRPRSNFVWAAVSLVLLSLFATNSFFVATNFLQIIFELALSAILACLVFVIWIRPKLVLRDEEIEVVNPLKTEFIPYRKILDLETKWSLTIVHEGGRTRVWVAPATGKRRWIADKKFGLFGSGVIPLSESREIGSETMSASLDSSSGQAAYMIRERIKKIS